MAPKKPTTSRRTRSATRAKKVVVAESKKERIERLHGALRAIDTKIPEGVTGDAAVSHASKSMSKINALFDYENLTLREIMEVLMMSTNPHVAEEAKSVVVDESTKERIKRLNRALRTVDTKIPEEGTGFDAVFHATESMSKINAILDDMNSSLGEIMEGLVIRTNPHAEEEAKSAVAE